MCRLDESALKLKVDEALAVLAAADEVLRSQKDKDAIMSPSGPQDFPASAQTTPETEDEAEAAAAPGAPAAAVATKARVVTEKALVGTARKLEADLESAADVSCAAGKGVDGAQEEGKLRRANNSRAAAARVAASLGEPKVPLVARALSTLGSECVSALVSQTEECESSGGMMTADGVRRRTKGGVFWALLRKTVSEAEYAEIFAEEKTRQRERVARRQRRKYARHATLQQERAEAEAAAKMAPSPEEAAAAKERSPGKRSFASLLRSD